MAFLPRAPEALPSKLHRRRLADRLDDNPEDHMPEWQREVRRLMRDCEKVREHCRRQMEMIAAQREFLKGSNPTHSLAPDKSPAGEGVNMKPEEGVSVGE